MYPRGLHMNATHRLALLATTILLVSCAGRQQAAAPTVSAVPTAIIAPTVLPTTPPIATPPPQQTATAPASAPTAAAAEPTLSQAAAPANTPAAATLQEYPVPRGSHPHDVAPAPDGAIWYTAQASGELGRLNPATGETRHIPLGER